MKSNAAVLYEMGKSRPYANSRPLVVEEIELAEPGPNEVVVEIFAAGLCHSDLSVINGSRPRPLPMVLGHEASGVIKDVGIGVGEFKPGDHVVCTFVPSCGLCVFCNIGQPALCERGARSNTKGTLLSGRKLFENKNGQKLNHHLGVSAFSQYTIVNQESLVKVESDIPLETAALFGCGVMTGAGAVINTARVEPGMSVAIFGLGGVGLSALLAAKVSGAYPIIAVDVSDYKLKLAQKAGATHLVNSYQDDSVKAILDITGGKGASYTFDCVGAREAFQNAYKATGRGGTTVAVGLPHYSVEFTLPGVGIVAEERTVKGSYMGSAVPRRDIPRLMRLYSTGVLPVDLLLTKAISLEEINTGFDDLAEGDVVRQIIQF